MSMADAHTRRLARYALKDLVEGHYQFVAVFLAKLGDVPVPELPDTTVSVLRRKLRTVELELAHARAVVDELSRAARAHTIMRAGSDGTRTRGRCPPG